MKDSDPRGEGQKLSLTGRTVRLPTSHILALALGAAMIVGVVAFLIHRNYQTTLGLWRSELGASVRYQSWTLLNSLQQSQDDAQVLADFAAVKELLLTGGGRSALPVRRTDLQKQVASLFDEYRKIYEYGVLYVLDDKGRVAVEAMDSPPWSSVAESQKFQKAFEAVMRSRKPAIEFIRGSEQELTLLFLTPVFAGARTIGAIVIADPFSRDILPLLTAKSVASRTGETLLLQLGAGENRYASPLRYASGVPGRKPGADTLRPAASTANDRATFGRFIDYRGVGVMAAMEKIPSINSVVVCKVDSKEALGDFRRVVRVELMAAVSILLAYIGMIVMHSRRAAARETREGLARQQVVNQILETTVAERTGQLAEINRQLQEELDERQKVEEEVRTLNAELDRRVHERTAELEAANKELEAFSYSVSHDLRAPLRRMAGFATILVEEYASHLPEEAQQFLRTVNKNAIQMGELIDCLLAFSQLGRQPLRKQEVAPADIVLEVWEDFCEEREGRRVEFTMGDLPACEADPMLLKQVFVNFLSNALKYSRTREVTKIEVGRTDDGVYYVRDNGVGFDMRYGEKLFGVFQRLHRAEDYEGVGVGLALVQRIIQRHGGRVWAESVLNQGSSFYFTLAPSNVPDAVPSHS